MWQVHKADVTLCQAHQQLSWPHALRSKLNPNTPQDLIDYSMTSPLTSAPGSFPCKGYQTNTPLVDTATYLAGQNYNMTLDGSATHGGGSCQISLSYDNGQTFKVLKSIIGGCTLEHTYNFTVPSYAPAGQALFAWSWTNYMGNREFYMNCAAVQVVSSTPSASRFNALPNIWVANLADINKCTTNAPNGALNVVYPDPGADVQYGGGMSKSSPPTTGDCEVPIQIRLAQEPSFAFDPEISTTASSQTVVATDPAFVFAPVSTTSDTGEVSSTFITTTVTSIVTTTSTTLSTTSTSLLFSITYQASTTTPVQTISPVQGSSSGPVSVSSRVAVTFGSFSPAASSLRSFVPVSTTTMTTDCPSTVVVTLPPTSFVATYTISSPASACTGTVAVCPCADSFACMAIGDCTWECMAVSTPTGPSFTTSIVRSTSRPISAVASTTSAALGTPIASTTTLGISAATSSPPSSPSPPPQPDYVSSAALSQFLPCIDDTFICTDPNTFYTCISPGDGTSSYQYPRQVAAGMMCLPNLSPGFNPGQGNTPAGFYRDDQYVRARPYGSCAVDGAYQCTNGGRGFQICDHGGWVDMGSVAPGTLCVNGQIVAA